LERSHFKSQLLVGGQQLTHQNLQLPVLRPECHSILWRGIDLLLSLRHVFSPYTSSIARAAASSASAILLSCSAVRLPRSRRIFRANFSFVIARLICGDWPRPNTLPAACIRPKIAFNSAWLVFRYALPSSVAAYSFLLPSVETTVARPSSSSSVSVGYTTPG